MGLDIGHKTFINLPGPLLGVAVSIGTAIGTVLGEAMGTKIIFQKCQKFRQRFNDF